MSLGSLERQAFLEFQRDLGPRVVHWVGLEAGDGLGALSVFVQFFVFVDEEVDAGVCLLDEGLQVFGLFGLLEGR